MDFIRSSGEPPGRDPARAKPPPAGPVWLLIALLGVLLVTVGPLPSGVAAAREAPPADDADVPDAGEAADGLVLFVVADEDIVEASGIAVDREAPVMYVVQDAGTDDTGVYVLSENGETIARVEVSGVVNEDWEDLALGPDDAGREALYIGDTGDAFFVRREAGLDSRKEYAIIRIAKPDLTSGDPSIVAEDVRVWRFAYADGLNHNAESLMVHPSTGRIYVIDKVEEGSERQGYVWVAPEPLSEDEVNIFTSIAPIDVIGASGAAFAPQGDLFVVRNATTAYVWELEGDDVARSMQRPPTMIRLPDQPQGEGVDFTADGRSLVINSEGANQPVYQVTLPPTLGAGGEASEVNDGAPGAPEISAAPLSSTSRPPLWAIGAALAWALLGLTIVALLRARAG